MLWLAFGVFPEGELRVIKPQDSGDPDLSEREPPVFKSQWLSAAPGLSTLRPALRRLDALLERLVTAQQASVPLRAVYVSPEEAARLLVREPCAPTLGAAADRSPLFQDSAFGAIAQRYGLSDFDLDVVLIALAPEFDLRYERLYGFLHDDITRRRATVDLALNLRCASVEEKIARLAHFTPDAPLIRHAVLHLVADPSHVQPPLLAHFLKVDDQIIGAALGRNSLDSRLAAFCRFHDSAPDLDALDVAAEMQPPLRALASAVRHDCLPPGLYFHGPRGAGRLAAARAFAAEIGARLLHADLARIADERDADTTLAILFREALLHEAVLYLDGIDAFRPDDKAPACESLAAALKAPHGIVILASELAVPPASIALVDLADLAFVPPDFALRRRWQYPLTLERGKTLVSFSGRLSTAGQVASVEVRGLDAQKQPISAVVQRTDTSSLSSNGRAQLAGSTALIANAPVSTADQAKSYRCAMRGCSRTPRISPGGDADLHDLAGGERIEQRPVGLHREGRHVDVGHERGAEADHGSRSRRAGGCRRDRVAMRTVIGKHTDREAPKPAGRIRSRGANLNIVVVDRPCCRSQRCR
jgi:hypothetical protein